MEFKNFFNKEMTPTGHKLPHKKHINLVRNDEHKNDKIAIVFFLVFLLCLGLFVKFFVIDRLNEVNALATQYSSMQTQLNALQEKTAEYDAVKEQYDQVTDWYLSDEEKMEVDKNDVFAMIDEDVLSYVTITGVRVDGNIVTIQTGDVTLQQISSAVSSLQNDARNSYVTVTTASSSNSSDNTNLVTGTIIVTYGGSVEGSAQ